MAANKPRGLLVLDMSYSLEAIRERKLEHSVTCRDLDGFFEHVWTVHPAATLVTSDRWTERFGRPVFHQLSPRHTFIEGKVGRFSFLRPFGALNFLLSQINLVAILVKLIRKRDISAVRAGSPLYTGLLGWVLSRISGIPLVLRIGENYDRSYQATGQPMQPRIFRKRWVEKIVERFVFARSDLVAGANQDNLDFALSNGARKERSTLFRYGNLVDQQHFTDPQDREDGRPLLAELGVESTSFLLYIGRLTPIKLADDVVRVLAELRQRHHKTKALLVGDGPMRQEIVALAATLGVSEDIVLCGNRDQEWLARVIPLAAVVVSPVTGRALTEAALGSAPIAAYDVDWQKELIQTGETGELVTYGNWKGLADATERLLTRSEYARQMGRAARAQALDMMDPQKLNKHEQEQYKALLQRYARPADKPQKFNQF